MDSFNKLIDVANQLLGKGGCPWDQEQTIKTLQPYLLEEVHELIEAIDLNDPEKLKEELGDAFYTIVFVAFLAEKEGYALLIMRSIPLEKSSSAAILMYSER